MRRSHAFTGGAGTALEIRPKDTSYTLDQNGNDRILALSALSGTYALSVSMYGGTLRDGTAPSSGAILMIYGSLLVDGMTFLDNTGTVYGGAISVLTGGLTLSGGTTFTHNRVTGPTNGGGAYFDNSSSVSSSTFSSNSADRGAGFFSGDAAITGSRFEENSAVDWGGALSLGSGGVTGTTTVSTSRFTRNASAKGGAIDSWSERLLLNSVEFRANRASEFGAVITRSGRTFRGDLVGVRLGRNRAPLAVGAVALYGYGAGYPLDQARVDARVWRAAGSGRVVFFGF